MLSTASVTVLSAAIAVPATDSAVASANAERIRFIARSSSRWSISRPEQHWGKVVERDGGQHQCGRRPQHRFHASLRQRPRAASVGAHRYGLPIDEVVADPEKPGGRGEEN